MEFITNVWTWIKAHWNEFVQIIGYLVGVATIIVRLTKSSKDDEFLGKLKKVLVYFSLVNEDGSSCIEKKEEKK